MKIYDFILLILIIVILNLIIFNLSYKEGNTGLKIGGNKNQLIELTQEKIDNDEDSVVAVTQVNANNINNDTVSITFAPDLVTQSMGTVTEVQENLGVANNAS